VTKLEINTRRQQEEDVVDLTPMLLHFHSKKTCGVTTEKPSQDDSSVFCSGQNVTYVSSMVGRTWNEPLSRCSAGIWEAGMWRSKRSKFARTCTTEHRISETSSGLDVVGGMDLGGRTMVGWNVPAQT